MSEVTELIADCGAHGILLLSAGGRLTIDAPHEALTPDLLARLTAHKPALLDSLGASPNTAPATPEAAQNAPAKPTAPVCRCGSTTWRDVPIHGGQSVRWDCGRCGRFIGFPIWYGKNTGQ